VLHETGGASQALSLFPRSGSVCRQARGTRSCLIEQVCRTARCPDAASDPGRKLAFAVPVHSAGMPVRREGLVARACAPDITTAASATHKPVTSHSAHRPANGPPGALPDGAALTAITSPLPAGWVAYLMPTSYRANLRRPLRRCSGRVAEPGAPHQRGGVEACPVGKAQATQSTKSCWWRRGRSPWSIRMCGSTTSAAWAPSVTGLTVVSDSLGMKWASPGAGLGLAGIAGCAVLYGGTVSAGLRRTAAGSCTRP
jgi:hypothetical protein